MPPPTGDRDDMRYGACDYSFTLGYRDWTLWMEWGRVTVQQWDTNMQGFAWGFQATTKLYQQFSLLFFSCWFEMGSECLIYFYWFLCFFFLCQNIIKINVYSYCFFLQMLNVVYIDQSDLLFQDLHNYYRSLSTSNHLGLTRMRFRVHGVRKPLGSEIKWYVICLRVWVRKQWNGKWKW